MREGGRHLDAVEALQGQRFFRREEARQAGGVQTRPRGGHAGGDVPLQPRLGEAVGGEADDRGRRVREPPLPDLGHVVLVAHSVSLRHVDREVVVEVVVDACVLSRMLRASPRGQERQLSGALARPVERRTLPAQRPENVKPRPALWHAKGGWTQHPRVQVVVRFATASDPREQRPLGVGLKGGHVLEHEDAWPGLHNGVEDARQNALARIVVPLLAIEGRVGLARKSAHVEVDRGQGRRVPRRDVAEPLQRGVVVGGPHLRGGVHLCAIHVDVRDPKTAERHDGGLDAAALGPDAQRSHARSENADVEGLRRTVLGATLLHPTARARAVHLLIAKLTEGHHILLPYCRGGCCWNMCTKNRAENRVIECDARCRCVTPCN